jgi:hypothetical protein
MLDKLVYTLSCVLCTGYLVTGKFLMARRLPALERRCGSSGCVGPGKRQIEQDLLSAMQAAFSIEAACV